MGDVDWLLDQGRPFVLLLFDAGGRVSYSSATTILFPSLYLKFLLVHLLPTVFRLMLVFNRCGAVLLRDG